MGSFIPNPVFGRKNKTRVIDIIKADKLFFIYKIHLFKNIL
ncbi:hypothetical protein Bsph_2584 [Lysinibacillus sphaericus C3-41]|uniref:Uncharacterized protein n=1 Tax=Lysinibacillus sphaericus (strain C3-41) TaxID=444177 RepID=B1HYH2_LYSSC|nr:hypothetical protein Bsph_2584 [Lysinibacillus sphaericus C3-41]